ncbi:gluconate 2-dehydrogenase subunit 3 family protein [Pedobacter steynii]|uniref:Twin-arginine translocation pathway signal protein n=1 Tax=Pedobacter steynii TaxID=430522 RepID=A0A1D7QKF8_9SPHI|nr:gluconate 2-dehydrogenase subunit 3 family protein [Pedobacter steynii]AOM79156.1 twin-arginine translocation pathway signal protein [Pedobacter steynii]
MERRELLKMIALLTGGVMIGGNALLTGCNQGHNTLKNNFFTEDEIDFLNEVSETILPETGSPGAKAANVGQFMSVMVKDCYEPNDQKAFQEGIKKLDLACEKMHQTGFMKVSPEQRLSLLLSLEKEAKTYQLKKPELEEAERKKNKDFPGLPNHYFIMMKQLTMLGYFTSEAGCTKALRYIAVPGRYEGSVPYKKGDKAWA